MTDEPQVSGQEEENVEEMPTPTFSEPSDDKPQSTVDVRTIAQEVAELLKPTIEKNVQRVKDKRFAKYDKLLGTINPATLEFLQEQGVDIPKSISDDLRLRLLEEQLSTLGNSSQPSQGKAVSVNAADWTAVIDKVGLDTKRPEVISFIRGNFRDLDDFELKARRLKDSFDNNPTPPEQRSSGQGSTPMPKDVEAYTAEYIEKMKAARGNRTEIRKLKDEYVKKGVDIYSQDFT